MNLRLILLVLLSLLAVFYVFGAVPEGPTTFIPNESSSKVAENTQNVSALAGNITRMTIAGRIATQSWQGYYGNITGLVTLENANGYTMYAWTLGNPQGEIYATEGTTTPQWGSPSQTGNISCWNYTKGESTNYPYLGEVEGWDALDSGETAKYSVLNVKKNAVDSINNTFQRLTTRPFPSFYVGNQYINGSGNALKCPSLATYNYTNKSTYTNGEIDADGSGTGMAAGGDFQEVILVDTTNFFLLYTAIIDHERDMVAFDGNVWDFQMLVPEDGHGTDTSTTEFNFYVELE